MREEQVHQAESGHDQERLQHLGEEREPHQGAGQREPADRVAARDSTARRVAYAEPTSSSVSSASGLSNRNISTATGVVASTTPASSPAAVDPVVRRTVA